MFLSVEYNCLVEYNCTSAWCYLLFDLFQIEYAMKVSNLIQGFRILITYFSHIYHLELGTSPADLPQDGSEQLPRPLLVIKGTTPTTVTLEWEWSLLPEQIAGADVLYSVLILGSKFHSNINSSLW